MKFSDTAEYIFLVFFICETAVRMWAMGHRVYFESSFNRCYAPMHKRLHQKFQTLTFSGLTAWSSVEVCSKWSGRTSSQRPARSVYPSSELSDFSGSSRSPSKSTTWGQCQLWRWWWFQCCLFSILMHPKAKHICPRSYIYNKCHKHNLNLCCCCQGTGPPLLIKSPTKTSNL